MKKEKIGNVTKSILDIFAEFARENGYRIIKENTEFFIVAARGRKIIKIENNNPKELSEKGVDFEITLLDKIFEERFSELKELIKESISSKDLVPIAIKINNWKR